jgi:hypothetical protein
MKWNLVKYQKGTYLSGGKAFNQLPSNLKNLVSDLKAFKSALKQFLYRHSFYSIEEYYIILYYIIPNSDVTF